MIQWLNRKIQKWALKSQKREIEDFIHKIKAMDGEELGGLVVIAGHIKINLESNGHLVSDPINYFSANPKFLFTMSQSIIQLQKKNKLVQAAGYMVWLHTLRASATQELRQLGRDMWAELERGFPYVEDAAEGMKFLYNADLNITEVTKFPLGFTPKPV